MRDKQIIKTLQLLRSVKPDEETIRFIHKKSTSQLFDEKKHNIRNWSIASIMPVVSLAVIVILFLAASGFLPNGIHSTIVTIEIAFAPNHYEKAQIAVANAESEFSSFKQHPTDANKLTDLSHSLALANTQMTKLQLVGEKGKYTMKDCLTLYALYYNSLESMKKTVSLQTNSSNENKSLLRQINQYDEQADQKLHLYKK